MSFDQLCQSVINVPLKIDSWRRLYDILNFHDVPWFINHISLQKRIEKHHLGTLQMDVTSADSQSLSILGTSFPDRAPSHGPGLFYAQRENRLIMIDIEAAIK